jgi:hypothetical protein
VKNINPWGLAQAIYTGCWIIIMTAQNLAEPEQVRAIQTHDEFVVAVVFVIYVAIVFGVPYLFGMKAALKK